MKSDFVSSMWRMCRKKGTLFCRYMCRSEEWRGGGGIWKSRNPDFNLEYLTYKSSNKSLYNADLPRLHSSNWNFKTNVLVLQKQSKLYVINSFLCSASFIIIRLAGTRSCSVTIRSMLLHYGNHAAVVWMGFSVYL
jgi:hypothetical protein